MSSTREIVWFNGELSEYQQSSSYDALLISTSSYLAHTPVHDPVVIPGKHHMCDYAVM